MTGQLIEMNAHMVVTESAWKMVAIGIVFLFVCVPVVLVTWSKGGWKWRGAVGAFIIAGMILIAAGVKTPRVKEIKACVNGPVSLEMVAAVYDIVDVDGKMLTLRER